MSKIEELVNFGKFWKRSKGYMDKRVTVNPTRDCRVELTIDGNRYAVYSAVPLIAPNDPTYNPNGGTYEKLKKISIECTTTDPSLNIYYTRADGSVEASLNPANPTESSSKYAGQITLNQQLGVAVKYYKFKAMSELMGEHSNIVEKTFAIEGVTENPTYNYETGTYTDDYLDVSIECTTSGSTIYYKKSVEGTSTDPGTPSSSDSSVFEQAIRIAGTTKFNAIGASTNWKNSSVITKTYTFKTKTPVITYSETSLANTRSVSITCSTPDSSIYYTIGGYKDDASTYTPADPSVGSTEWLPDSSLILDGTKKIKAFAVTPRRNNSAIATEVCDFKVGKPKLIITQTDQYDETISFKVKNNDVDDASIFYTISGDVTQAATSLGKLAHNADSSVISLTSTTGAKSITISSYGTRDHRDQSALDSSTITYGRSPFIICTPDPTVAKTPAEATTGLNNGTITIATMKNTKYIKVATKSGLNGRTESYDTTVVGMFMILVPKNWGISTTESLKGKIKSPGGPFNINYVGTLNNWNCYTGDSTLSAGAVDYDFQNW